MFISVLSLFSIQDLISLPALQFRHFAFPLYDQINACAHCFRGAYGFYSVFVFQKPKLLGDSYSLLEIAGKCTELSLLQTRGGPCRQKEGTFSAATRRADDPGYRRADGFLCLSILHHRSYPSCPGSEAKTRGIADGGKLSETKFLPPHLNGA